MAVLVFYCCVANYHKLSGLKQYPLLVHSSVVQTSGRARPGCFHRFLQGQNQGVAALAPNMDALG